jgi:hypothetical protein
VTDDSEAFIAGREAASTVIAVFLAEGRKNAELPWQLDLTLFFLMGVQAHEDGWADDKTRANEFLEGVIAASKALDGHPEGGSDSGFMNEQRPLSWAWFREDPMRIVRAAVLVGTVVVCFVIVPVALSIWL